MDKDSNVDPLVVTPDGDNKVRIACPECGHVRIVSAEKFPDSRKVLRVKCVCGQTFPCRLRKASASALDSNMGADVDAAVFAGLPGPPAPGMKVVVGSPEGDGPMRVECPHCQSTRYVARERFQLGERSLVIQCGCEKSFVLRMGSSGDEIPAEAKARPKKKVKPKPKYKPNFELPEVVAEVVKSAAKAKPKPRSEPPRIAASEATEARPQTPPAGTAQKPAAPEQSTPEQTMEAPEVRSGGEGQARREESGQWSIGNAEPGAGDGDDLRRFYADKQGNLHIACPSCEYVKNVPVSGLSKLVQPARVHCVCGNVFHCFLEFRRTYRKEVSLPGDYICLRDKDEGPMVVQDLSLEGIGFRTMGPHSMELDDIVEVRFELDDRSRSKIRRQVRVRSVRGRFIVGAMFANLHFRDKALGFYLMP